MKRYDRAKYWDAVGDSIASSPTNRRGDVAGQDTEFFRYKRDSLLRLLDRFPWQGRSVLEVGCGPGGNVAHLIALGAKQVIGIDVSSAMAREASQHVAALGPNVGVLVADGTHLPLPSRSIDIGLTVTVLQHLDIDSAASVVSEIGRVSRHELILCEDISIISVGLRTTHVMRRKTDYVEMAGRAGFRLKESRPLKVFMSEVITTLVRGALDGVLQPDYEHPSVKRWAVERALLPLTQFVDPYMPQLAGLVCLRFVRDSEAHNADEVAS